MVTPAAAVAARTERVSIGTGILGLWSRTPATTALTAASLQQLSQGRLLLGLGLQSRSYVESWHGRAYGKPLGAMREYLTILRRALDGETVTQEGDYFSIRGFHIDLPPPETRVPLYVAAIGPKMLQLAGELADGVIGYVYSEEYVRNVVVPNIQLGAERVGRTLEGFDIACGFPSVVTDDDAGIELARGQAMMFATATKSAPAYAESIAQAGFRDERDEIARLVGAGDLEGAVAAGTRGARGRDNDQWSSRSRSLADRGVPRCQFDERRPEPIAAWRLLSAVRGTFPGERAAATVRLPRLPLSDRAYAPDHGRPRIVPVIA